MPDPSDTTPAGVVAPEDTPTMVAPAAQRGVEFTPGTILLDRYRVVSRLGKGGMGEVYRADDLKLGQPVALKFVVPRLAQQQQQLVDEVRVGRKVSHPNVCRLHDIGEIEGRHFISMEYIDGEDLGSLLRRIGRLPSDKAASLAREITAGVVAAHDCGVVHRDLKPANVMIDGRGSAHITDFGLARIGGAGSNDTFSGTPPYMAPEQFAGEPATASSDVYALGLIFFELWTGKRLFAGNSIPDIVKMHTPEFVRGTLRTAPELDPQIATLIETCLDDEPSRRPASARAVLALLPGRDALDSAIAAAQTPSPAVVAAATERGDLTRPQAWALFGGIVAMLALLLVVNEATALHRVVELKYPAEVLQSRCTAILGAIGWGERELPLRDSDGWFLRNSRLMTWREEHAHRRVSLARAIQFVYRQSGGVMVSTFADGNPMLSMDDPPLTKPGMARLILDSRGRLTSLQVIPPERLPGAVATAPDWPALLQFAGLDPKSAAATAPTRSAPVDNDTKAAWVARDPLDGTTLHIEAASLRGRPVWFSVMAEWDRDDSAALPRRPGEAVSNFVITIVMIAVAIGAFLLVRRNLRRGQGDIAGATKLALFVLFATSVAGAMRAHHPSNVLAEAELGAGIFMRAVYVAFFMWAGYVALEPLVRRRWPRTLISWSRLLEGRFRDPIIGRDVLIGFAATLGLFVLSWMAVEVFAFFAKIEPPPNSAAMSVLSHPRFIVYFLLYAMMAAVTRGAGLLLELVIVRALLRSQAAAVGLVLLVFVAAALPMMEGPFELRLMLALIVAIPPIVVVMRYGLLALCALTWLVLVFMFIPLTIDPASWQFVPTLTVVAVIVAIAFAAFHVSLGGKPMLPAPILED